MAFRREVLDNRKAIDLCHFVQNTKNMRETKNKIRTRENKKERLAKPTLLLRVVFLVLQIALKRFFVSNND